MQFCDEATINIKSGTGGKGSISFRREKYIPKGGPNGGNGGKGGNIIIESDANLTTLIGYKYKKHFIGENGKPGRKNNASGISGKNIVLKVPIGTQIYDTDTKELLHDFTQDKESLCIATGGIGGIGNTCFKSSTNQAPRKALPGRPGEEKNIKLTLKIIADIGIIGLPNAGKSTLLSKLTNATPKIASYPFSTLIPQLGSIYYNYKKYVIADIPGIIKGASKGYGLGDKFLQHIERCNALIHVMDISSSSLIEDYNDLHHELKTYSNIFSKKKIFTCLSKSDLLTDSQIKKTLQNIKHHIGYHPYIINHNAQDIIYKMLESIIKTFT